MWYRIIIGLTLTSLQFNRRQQSYNFCWNEINYIIEKATIVMIKFTKNTHM